MRVFGNTILQDNELRMEQLPLKMGQTCSKILWVQRVLEGMGYPLSELDGTFGVETLRTVIAFQYAHQLPLEGIVTKQTLKILSTYAATLEIKEDQAIYLSAKEGRAVFPVESVKVEVKAVPWKEVQEQKRQRRSEQIEEKKSIRPKKQAEQNENVKEMAVVHLESEVMKPQDTGWVKIAG